MQPITVWIQSPDPKARYALDQLLGVMLGWSVRFVPNPEELDPRRGPCLVYGAKGFDGAFHIQPTGWLRIGRLPPIEPDFLEIDGVPVLFPESDGHLAFDVVAAAFFMLARFEEWAGLPEDAHGRPVTSNMHAARHGYLGRPVVDEWALLLAEKWRSIDTRVPEPIRAYRQVATVDLDNGFKYLGRSWWRTLGAWSRDLIRANWDDAHERIQVLAGRVPDPFILDDKVLHTLTSCAERSIAFVLAADRGRWDHAVAVDHPAYAIELRRLAGRMEVGVHPSYNSSVTEGLTESERDRLSRAVGIDVSLSRQHFLRFRTPGTFRTAIDLGIREEHSMGCHDQLGFRAGTCTPYEWYDLEHDAPTSVVIHPFCVMDNTLRIKLGLDPAQAVESVRPIIEAVRRVRGTFTGLWHESYLAQSGRNRPWREAMLRIIEEAAP